MTLLYQIALVKIKTFGHGQIGSISEVIRINDFSKSSYDEIDSYLDTEFQRKSAPIWIPNSKGKSAPNCTGILQESAPIWIPIPQEIGSEAWIPNFREIGKISSVRFQKGREADGQISVFHSEGINL
ncbi:hypothetical protein RIR_jg36127.t1 [Rhizophagus irregularis DAOM 181602=DAOM 197198]|nr:hypothetical protein RIR_jg36127.t1 [Rhizophagus irregularis DAOM 181602=DAOM 197198]